MQRRDLSRIRLLRAGASLLLAVLLAGCVFVEVGVEPRLTPTPRQDGGPAALTLPGSEADVTPTTTAELAQPTNPGTDVVIDCADVVPFAPGCLAQERPPELGDRASFVGIVPDAPVMSMAWSPEGRRLAYAVRNPEGWQGLVVRSLPDYRVVARWEVPGPFDLAWTPDGDGLVFAFDRDVASSVGMARMGSPVWHDMLPGERAVLSTSQGKFLGEWLSGSTVALRQTCGTGCVSLYALNVVSGDLQPLVNVPDAPHAPYGGHFATQYAFSASREWLAAVDWGRGLPTTRVLPWPDPGEPLDPTASLGGRYAEAMGWSGDDLLLYVFAQGEPSTWEDPVPSVYSWNPDGTLLLIGEAAYAPKVSPSGGYLALVALGRATVDDAGRLIVLRDAAHVTMLAWPSLGLTASEPLGGDPDAAADLWLVVDAPVPQWLGANGEMVVIRNAAGELVTMDTRGRVSVLLKTADVAAPRWLGFRDDKAISRGANGDIAMLVGDAIWVASLG